jgi:TonB-linked SusC/RagA family outer membrane protein
MWSYMNIKQLLFVLSMLLFSQQVIAQDVTVSGRVTDAQTGEPLVGVSILVEGTARGEITNLEGEFQLTVRQGENALIFSYIGYSTSRVTIDGRRVINVQLTPEVTRFEDVVVTAFGIERERRALGYSLQDVDGDDLARSGANNLLNSLQGQVAGVQINRGGGGAGQGSQIFIRGFTSLDPSADNQPLFVVDGVPISNETIESTGRPRGMSNRAIDIAPEDIESVTVLRSAPATALYGVRASNGAIIITTKKGEVGDVRVNFSHSISREDIVNTPDYQNVFGPGFGNEFNPNSFWPAWGNAFADHPTHTQNVNGVPTQFPMQYYNNWKNSMETGIGVNNAINISGGTRNTTFYTSVSDSRNSGVIPNNDWNRTSVRLNGTARTGALTMGASMNFINSGGNRIPFVNFMERLAYWNTTADVRNWRFDDGRHRGDDVLGLGTGRNPIFDAKSNTYVDNVNRLIGNVNASLDVTDWLALDYRIGIDTYSDERTEIEPGPLGLANEFAWSNGFREENTINSRDISSNLSLRFRRNLSEDISFEGRVGSDIFDRQRKTVRARGEIFEIPQFAHFSNAQNIVIGQSLLQRRLLGAFADVNIGWRDIAYVNITGRNDWTSTLAKDNRSFFYPSVSLSVVYSDLLELPEWMTYGKLRVSYAQVGKDAPPYRLSSVYVSPAEFPLGGQRGFTRGATLASPDLKPERTTSNELGLDFRFLDNRISLDVSMYQSNSRDMIINVPVSLSTGFSQLTSNAGDIENRGIELTLRATPYDNRSFRWDIVSNYTRNRNEVLSIMDGVDAVVLGSVSAYIYSPRMQLVPGQSYGAIWGTSYRRFYGAGEQPKDPLVLEKDRPLLIGPNGFPVIDTEYKVVGDALPDWTLSIGNNFVFKNWDLTMNFDIVMGVDKYNKLDQWDAAFGHTTKTLNRTDYVVFDGFLADGSRNTREVWLGIGVDPRDGVNYGAGYHRNVYRLAIEESVEDASYIKLRTLGVGYTLTRQDISSLPFRSLRVGMTANNLLLWTPWSQYDPEAFVSSGSNLIGLVDLAYPGTRSLMFSLNFSF